MDDRNERTVDLDGVSNEAINKEKWVINFPVGFTSFTWVIAMHKVL